MPKTTSSAVSLRMHQRCLLGLQPRMCSMFLCLVNPQASSAKQTVSTVPGERCEKGGKTHTLDLLLFECCLSVRIHVGGLTEYITCKPINLR